MLCRVVMDNYYNIWVLISSHVVKCGYVGRVKNLFALTIGALTMMHDARIDGKIYSEIRNKSKGNGPKLLLNYDNSTTQKIHKL